MAKIISLESRRAEHAERCGSRPGRFPWNELTEYTGHLAPVTSRLPVNKRWMVEESVYRLAYRSFLLGIQASPANLWEVRNGAETSRWKESVERISGRKGTVDQPNGPTFNCSRCWMSG